MATCASAHTCSTIRNRNSPVWRLFFALGFTAFLAACAQESNRSTDAPPMVVTYDPQSGQEVVTTSREAYNGSIFARENVRETVFSGDTKSRIGSPDNRGETGFIDTRGINSGPTSRVTSFDFEGELSDRRSVVPLNQQQIDGALWQPKYDESPTVNLSYENAPLSQVIQDILGGILGQNFIIGDTVAGTLTLRSETRFAQSQLVQVLADILSKDGYLIRYFNGIYYVGTPEELNTLVASRSQSLTAQGSAKIVPVETDDIAQFVNLIQSLAPPSVRVGPAPDGQGLFLQGDPALFPSIEALVQSLVDTGVSSQRVAVVSIRARDPESIASEVQSIYEARGIDSVTVLPLQGRQGVMVATNSRNGLRQVRELIRSLDQRQDEDARLRVIQLVHTSATDVAAQINEVFGQAGIPTASAEDETSGSAVLESAASLGSQSASEATSVTAPTTITGGSRNSSSEARQPTRSVGAAPSGGISVAADERNNALLIRSTYAEFVRIHKVVKTLDTKLSQVVIEATVVEVDINDELQLGVQLFLERNGVTLRSTPSAGGVADPGGSGFTGVFSDTSGGTQVSAVISALQAVSNVKVISSPYVTVANGSTSRLSVGNQIPFVTTSQSSSSNGNVVVTQEVETRDIGVILEVTPTIRPDNTVLLEVDQTVSSAGSVSTTAGSNPTIAQRSVSSQVAVASGNTVLLGGLISERSETSEGGVPVLRRLPGVGNLFNNRTNTQNRSELLILITPRVVRNTDSLSRLTEALRWSASTR